MPVNFGVTFASNSPVTLAATSFAFGVLIHLADISFFEVQALRKTYQLFVLRVERMNGHSTKLLCGLTDFIRL